jgi:tetratricopeptide (TPR) repeat protein
VVSERREAFTDFVAQLVRLRELAGSPSLNRLAALSADMERPLPRSTISDKLNGKSLPEWYFVVSFTAACRLHAEQAGLSLPPEFVDISYWDRAHLQMLRGVDDTRADERLVAAARAELGRRASHTAPADRPAPPEGDRRIVPHQLPAAARNFVGRTAELASLSALATATEPGVPVILAIEGTAGIGKTTLALHWAHRAADQFPDGQLYVNLRGYDPTGPAMLPDVALYRFLEAFAIPGEQIPAAIEARAAQYRSVLAGRRVLIVLDNAHDADQVRPLLPGTPGCLVVVTSRTQLTSLVVSEGARWLTLDLLSEHEARDLLEGRLGADRLAAEPQAAHDIITRCARLPLALSIVAARAATHPRHPLATLAGELDDTPDRLDAYDGGSPAVDVRSVFSWSYHKLTPPAAGLFRLLGLHPGPDIAVPAAVTLAARPERQVRRLLAELAQANLITEHSPGRYTFHDLLRAYATELADTHDTEADRRSAVRRLLDHYLHTAYACSLLLDPHRLDALTTAPPDAAVVLGEVTNHDQALAWFAADAPVLLVTIGLAGTWGFDHHAYQLARNLAVFLARQGRYTELIATQGAGLTAAERLNDQPAQAYAHRSIGLTEAERGNSDEANRHLRSALDLYEAVGDSIGEAQTHLGICREFERQGRYRDALKHAEEAYDLYIQADHATGQANALNSVGWCHGLLGEYHQARAACERALALVQQVGDRWVEAAVWDSLGYAHHHLREYRQAALCYQQSATLCRDLGDRPNEAQTLIHLGDTHHDAGNRVAARVAWQRALGIRIELNHPDTAPITERLQRLNAGAGPT